MTDEEKEELIKFYKETNCLSPEMKEILIKDLKDKGKKERKQEQTMEQQ